MTGYQIGEINDNGWYQSVYPDPEIQAKAIERMAQIHKGVDLDAEELEIVRSDGKNRTLRISTSIMDHSDGIPRIMAIMHFDFCAAVKKPYQIQDMGRVLHAVVHAYSKKNRG